MGACRGDLAVAVGRDAAFEVVGGANVDALKVIQELRLPKPLPRKCVTGTGLQIPLKVRGLQPIRKRQIGHQPPRGELRRVR